MTVAGIFWVMTRCTLIVAYVADTQPRRNGVRFYVPSHINTHFFKFAYLSRKHGSSICVEKKNQLDVTECFIALMICSTCFGHFYAHHQELETICVLLPPMVCSAWLLVVGGQVQGNRVCVQEEGKLHDDSRCTDKQTSSHFNIISIWNQVFFTRMTLINWFTNSALVLCVPCYVYQSDVDFF